VLQTTLYPVAHPAQAHQLIQSLAAAQAVVGAILNFLPRLQVAFLPAGQAAVRVAHHVLLQLYRQVPLVAHNPHLNQAEARPQAQ